MHETEEDIGDELSLLLTGERWQFERDFEGDILTEVSTDETLLDEYLDEFDNARTFFFSLWDVDGTESCLRSFGEPDRRVIEIDLYEGNRWSHFVLAHEELNDAPARVRVRAEAPHEFMDVLEDEIFSAAEVAGIFGVFLKTRRLPLRYRKVKKDYWFATP